MENLTICMGNQKFEQEIEHWINKVYQKCNELGKTLNKDYYPFQCSKESLQNGVELLIIGANPGGNNPFPTNKEINGLFSCGADGSNAFITYKDDPQWKINLTIFHTSLYNGCKHIAKIKCTFAPIKRYNVIRLILDRYKHLRYIFCFFAVLFFPKKCAANEMEF